MQRVCESSIIDLVDMGEKLVIQWQGKKVRYVLSYLDEFSHYILLELLESKHAKGVAGTIHNNNQLLFFCFLSHKNDLMHT